MSTQVSLSMKKFSELKKGEIIEKKGYLWNLYKVESFFVDNTWPQSPKNGLLARSIGDRGLVTIWEDEFNQEGHLFFEVANVSEIVDKELYTGETLRKLEASFK